MIALILEIIGIAVSWLIERHCEVEQVRKCNEFFSRLDKAAKKCIEENRNKYGR